MSNFLCNKKIIVSILLGFLVSLCIVILIVFSRNSNASSTNSSKSDIIGGVKVCASSKINLYNLDKEISGSQYATPNGGYVVFDTNDEVVEYSETFSGYIKESNTKDVYYLGPFQYYEKQNDAFINMLTNQKVYNNNELYEIQFDYEDVIELDISFSNDSPALSPSIATGGSHTNTSNTNKNTKKPLFIKEEDLFRYKEYELMLKNKTLPLDTNHTPNSLGHCGSTAAAITFLYHYHNGQKNFAKEEWAVETTGWQKYTDHLVKIIEPKMTGSTSSMLKKGINQHLKQQNISAKYTDKTIDSFFHKHGLVTIYDTLKETLEKDCPSMIGVYNHPSYKNHWVVCEGIRGYNLFDRLNYYYVVNDGLGHTNIEISSKYANTIVYRFK